jgi:hypothetical protein
MALQNFAFVTVRRNSPNSGIDLPQPQRRLVALNGIYEVQQNLRRGGSVLKITSGGGVRRKFEIFETITQFNTAMEPTNTNSAPDANLTVSANGTTIASTAVLTVYYNIVTTAATGVNDAVRLPAVAGSALRVVVNRTAVPVLVFPNAAGEAIVNKSGVQLANGASISIPAGETWHFSSNGTVNRAAQDA